ncbi:MAG: hypothetical protein IT327_13770 [Anaerolineae bacterium]|nr:hypothetical protein [Anaerolineae bacterium]
MKKAARIFALCCLFLLFGCQEEPAEQVAEATAVASEMATEAPTEIPTEPATATTAPTNTTIPTETATDVPTDTPEPTATNTASPTAEPTEEPTATAVPATATATTAPPAPVSAPPPAPVVSAGNMLSNPSFELGNASWEVHNSGQSIQNFYAAASNPQFVHSGQQAALQLGPMNASTLRNIYFQRVSGNVTPGATYRASAWIKIWSSSGENRLISENPGDFSARLCLNTVGESDPLLPTSVCTGFVRPLDTWQLISVDAVAASDRLSIMLVSEYTGANRPVHNEAIWDDASIAGAPSSATATPPPAAGPVRPNPIAFNPTALRDSMNSVRSMIEQEGGLLDRLYNGQGGTCAEFQGYYDDAIRSATYSGVPDDWAGIYNDYIFAVENFLATNESINSLCDNGGGTISALNYGAARTGINDSLNRLIPAIEAANAKLGG